MKKTISSFTILGASAGVNYLCPAQTHGPIVKTGPTKGQVRSRNQNGQWRKKRCDAGKSRI